MTERGRRARAIAAGAACLAACLLAGGAPARAGSLCLEERIASRRAVEEVHWRHRIWPAENPSPKPSLDRILPPESVRLWVEDDLAKSEALASLWGRGITAADLQAEMDRIAASTKEPARLREIFDALDDDPDRIAEAVARPALADRLLRNRYAFDERFHATVREEAERALSRDRSAASMRSLGGTYAETEFVREGDDPGSPGARRSGAVRVRSGAEWERFAGRLEAWFEPRVRATGPGRRPEERPDPSTLLDDLPEGVAGRLQESEEAFFVTAVLEKAPGRIRLATTTWPKRPFDDWWASERAAFAGAALARLAAATEEPAPTSSPGARSEGGASALSLPSISGSACADDTWSAVLSAWIPEERDSFAAVWTGSEMIVWGGAGIAPGGVRTGGRYNPATDTWTPTSTSGSCPSRRWGPTAVWTGSEMIVWGGADGSGQLDTGARYAPATDSWTPTSNGANVPSPRDSHTAVWTGSEMIVWGGNDQIGFLATGARYDPSADAWTPVSGGGAAPDARYLHTAVWTGAEMIVWGGWNELALYMNTGGRYNPATDSWSATSTGANVPQPAGSHAAVWTGSRMVVWGGLGAGGYLDTGGRYDPATDTWAATSMGANLPSPRDSHTAVWTGSEMIVWGGISNSVYVNTGGRYDPVADSWTATSAGTNVPAPRAYHAEVWTGAEMIVWGGYSYDGAEHILDSGGRYLPSGDTWVPVVGWSDPRRSHSAVWTGSEVIVWGGERLRPPEATVTLATGGRYTPATDTWSATPTGAGAPARRSNHTAIWTGTEMIVWGGNGTGYTNTGSRYSPAANAWLATSTGANVPSARAYHTAVWSGAAMIVWGGTNGASSQGTGGRYDPSSDSWAPVAAGPQSRYAHTAVWAGSEMIVWGGTYRPSGGSPTRLNTGGRYDPASNSWTATSTAAGLPAARESHTAVWTGSEMIVWGGSSGTAYLSTGGRYAPGTDSWSATSTGANLPPPRAFHQAVWSGSEMIVWGGSWSDGTTHLLDSGGRYDPAADSWRTTSLGSGLPPARDTHAAVWTSAGMIVWGGRGAAGSLANGGRYCASACASPPPAGSPLLSVGASGGSALLSWAPLAGAASYDLVRGGLISLRLSGGNFTSSTTGCLAEDSIATSAPDAAAPSIGDGFWYLVRGVSCGGAGSYDEGSTSQRGARDAEIGASSGACR